MKKYPVFILIAAIVGLSSCATWRIEKRHYNGGWYVDFGTDKNTATPVESAEKESDAPALPEVEKQSEAISVGADSDKRDGGIQIAAVNNENIPVDEDVNPAEPSTEDISTSEPKQNENPVDVKQKKSGDGSSSYAADDQLILLVILAILIPPLAVYMKQGITTLFWITLICWLIGGTFLFGRFGYGYIGGLGLLAIVLALLVVFDKL